MRNENETEEDMPIEDDELIVKVRISDGWEYNQQYKILLTFAGLGVTKNHSILLEFERLCLPFNIQLFAAHRANIVISTSLSSLTHQSNLRW